MILRETFGSVRLYAGYMSGISFTECRWLLSRHGICGVCRSRNLLFVLSLMILVALFC